MNCQAQQQSRLRPIFDSSSFHTPGSGCQGGSQPDRVRGAPQIPLQQVRTSPVLVLMLVAPTATTNLLEVSLKAKKAVLPRSHLFSSLSDSSGLREEVFCRPACLPVRLCAPWPRCSGVGGKENSSREATHTYLLSCHQAPAAPVQHS